MLTGGLALAVAAAAAALGEWQQVEVAALSVESLAALAYLIVFGSIVAFTAYMWLLRVTSAALVATYAYVNPVVAVWLGWWLADETLAPRTLIAATVILAGVAVIITFGRSYRPAPES